MLLNITDFLKTVDYKIAPLLLECISKTPKKIPDGRTVSNILVIRPGGIGDATLLLPALKEVFNKNEKLEIDALCEPRNMGVFKAAPFVRKIYSYRSFSDLFTIYKKKYDLIVDTEQSHLLSSIVTKCLNADTTVGFKANGREKCFHMSFEYTHNQYEAEVFWSIFKKMGFIKGDVKLDPPYFKPLPIRPDVYTELSGSVCIFSGASVEEKMWPEERWAKVIDSIAEGGYQPILLGSRNEYLQCKKIAALCSTRNVKNMCGKLSLHQTAGLFEHASLLISTDSGLLHIAVLSNLPTVSLFGSGNALKWGPKGNRHIVINKKLDCSPCTEYARIPPCPNGRRCILEITSDDVAKSALSLLENQ